VTDHVHTADGVRIAYDREGSGQPLVLIGGAGQFRAVDPATRALATELAGRGVERLFLWEVPLDEEEGTGGAEHLAAVRALLAAGDREGVWRLWMEGMPPEWFEQVRTGPQWPLFERMAPSLEADAEALAWTRSAPRRQLWGSVTAPTVVLVGTSTFPFMADAADSVVAALPHAERVEVAGHDHGWEPDAMAAALAAALPLSGGPGGTRSS
jgi:hypothetical protein